MADAMGYQDRCPTNTTFLRSLDIQTPWSGTHGATAVGKNQKDLPKFVFSNNTPRFPLNQ